MSRVTRSVKFSDNGPISGSRKSTGCSESESTSSLVNRNEVADPLITGEKAGTSILTITVKADRWTSGVAVMIRRRSHIKRYVTLRCSQNIVNSTVISRTPQEPAGICMC